MSFDAERHNSYPDALIESILKSVKIIALIGFSSNQARPSYFVTKYLIERGYTLYPINPGLKGQEFFGAKVYGALNEIEAPIDMVEIFRNSEAAGPLTDEALQLKPLPKVIWMQLGVRNDDAAARAVEHRRHGARRNEVDERGRHQGEDLAYPTEQEQHRPHVPVTPHRECDRTEQAPHDQRVARDP